MKLSRTTQALIKLQNLADTRSEKISLWKATDTVATQMKLSGEEDLKVIKVLASAVPDYRDGILGAFGDVMFFDDARHTTRERVNQVISNAISMSMSEDARHAN